MKQQILIVSHCFLNDAAKLKDQSPSEFSKERDLKRVFLKQMLSQDVELIQLPCPEFLLYGCNRWGHAASQFDTPHFRAEARRMLEPIIMQLEEYNTYPDRFEILGILGIDGSPSCGVNYTYDGNWGGEFSGNAQLSQTLGSLKKVHDHGIFMGIIKEMLREKHLPVKLYSLDTFASISTAPIQRDAAQVDMGIYERPKKPETLLEQSASASNGISLL